LARQHAHADEVGAMDALETASDDRPHAQQSSTFGSPVARTARAIVLSRDHDRRHALLAVALGGIVDAQGFAAGLISSDPALHARRHLVADANVGEGSANHDLMVAAPRSVAVEILDGDALLAQVAAGG